MVTDYLHELPTFTYSFAAAKYKAINKSFSPVLYELLFLQFKPKYRLTNKNKQHLYSDIVSHVSVT